MQVSTDAQKPTFENVESKQNPFSISYKLSLQLYGGKCKLGLIRKRWNYIILQHNSVAKELKSKNVSLLHYLHKEHFDI